MTKKNETEITGRLEGWSYDPMYRVYWGYIYEDIHGRFVDGTRIHTSSTTQKDGKEGDLIVTRNSTYLLGKPFDMP